MVARVVSTLIRLLVAVGAGYSVSAGLTAFTAVALPTTTALSRNEAVVLTSMLAFLIYLAILIWAFVEPRLLRLCVVLAVAGFASWGGALGLVRLVG